ncbi:hypothetical protein NFI96_010876 [Prochilodus magdalenae]|nr:hypothetical protein NFI96_010876 [Prochilodus magdalenae]
MFVFLVVLFLDPAGTASPRHHARTAGEAEAVERDGASFTQTHHEGEREEEAGPCSAFCCTEEEEVDKMMEQKMKEEEERKRKKEMEERMSLEETKEQIMKMEEKLQGLQEEKHQLFLQLKKVLHEEEKRRRKEQSDMTTLTSAAYQPNMAIHSGQHLLSMQASPVSHGRPAALLGERNKQLFQPPVISRWSSYISTPTRDGVLTYQLLPEMEFLHIDSYQRWSSYISTPTRDGVLTYQLLPEMEFLHIDSYQRWSSYISTPTRDGVLTYQLLPEMEFLHIDSYQRWSSYISAPTRDGVLTYQLLPEMEFLHISSYQRWSSYISTPTRDGVLTYQLLPEMEFLHISSYQRWSSYISAPTRDGVASGVLDVSLSSVWAQKCPLAKSNQEFGQQEAKSHSCGERRVDRGEASGCCDLTYEQSVVGQVTTRYCQSALFIQFLSPLVVIISPSRGSVLPERIMASFLELSQVTGRTGLLSNNTPPRSLPARPYRSATPVAAEQMARPLSEAWCFTRYLSGSILDTVIGDHCFIPSAGIPLQKQLEHANQQSGFTDSSTLRPMHPQALHASAAGLLPTPSIAVQIPSAKGSGSPPSVVSVGVAGSISETGQVAFRTRTLPGRPLREHSRTLPPHSQHMRPLFRVPPSHPHATRTSLTANQDRGSITTANSGPAGWRRLFEFDLGSTPASAQPHTLSNCVEKVYGSR